MSPVKVPTAAKHPLDAPSEDEILAVTATIRPYLVEKHGVKAVRFLNVMLADPEKNAVIEAGHFPGGAAKQSTSGKIERQFWAHVVDLVKVSSCAEEPDKEDVVLMLVLSVHLQGDSFELLATLGADGVSIASVEKLPEGTQPSLTIEELCLAEEKCRADPRVVKVAADVGVPPEQ